MFTLSAFADEISPDPQEQIDVLSRCGVRHIELRSILKTNVLDLTDVQVRELKSLLDRHGFRLSAIGSPVGKIKIDQPFEPHLKRFERAIELCKVFDTPNIRVFSYYPPGDAPDWNGVDAKWWPEVLGRMEKKSALASKAGVRMLHENEHRIYGDSPERVERLSAALAGSAFAKVYDAANYVFCGYDPWDGWQKTKAGTAHFHIKDWKAGATHGSLCGEGDGRWPDVLDEATRAGYDGFATLEPHLLGGGPTGGVTGPELFPKAVAAFTALLDRIGAKYR
jgi:sugar phosphate isomerase/epimerase